jgi:hypothetical protein
MGRMMSLENVSDRRSKLLLRKQQIEERLKAIDARENEKARKADTRRKILAGAFCLAHAENKPEFKKWLLDGLDKTLKDADKALFPELVETTDQSA